MKYNIMKYIYIYIYIYILYIYIYIYYIYIYILYIYIYYIYICIYIYISVLNYYIDGSSQWKMLPEIDVPKMSLKRTSEWAHFFGYWTVKNLQLYWLLLCPEFPQECLDPEEVINSHVHFLPNNRKTKSGKNRSSS